MLTNNFRQLISFYTSGAMTNVLGNTMYKKDFLGGHGYAATFEDNQTSQSFTLNGHDWRASTLSYDYNATTATNEFTQEKTAYKWTGVVCKNSSLGAGFVALFYNGFVLFVGDGNTPATAEDYCLSNAVELDVVSAYCNTNSYNKTFVSRTFENNTGADVTIKEVGCYIFRSMATTAGYATAAYAIMVGRIVLPAPVTIGVGEQKTFTYCIDLSTISLG